MSERTPTATSIAARLAAEDPTFEAERLADILMSVAWYRERDERAARVAAEERAGVAALVAWVGQVAGLCDVCGEPAGEPGDDGPAYRPLRRQSEPPLPPLCACAPGIICAWHRAESSRRERLASGGRAPGEPCEHGTTAFCGACGR